MFKRIHRFLFIAAFLLFALSANAIENIQQASALAVSPPEYDYNLIPGQTITGEFTVINNDSLSGNFVLKPINVTFEGEDALPKFDIFEIPAEGTIASWITITPNVISLSSKTLEKVSFKITVPYNAEVGTHVALLSISDNPNTADDGSPAQVGVGKLLGMSFIVNIPGAVTIDPSVNSYELTNSFDFMGMHFLELFTPEFKVRMQNNGNTYYLPSGTIVLRDSNKGIVKDLRVNESMNRVLPNSLRAFKVAYAQNQDALNKYNADPKNFANYLWYYLTNMAIGQYNADLSIDPRIKNQEISFSKQITFIVFPVKLAAIILLLIVLVAIIKILQSIARSKKQVRGRIL